MSSTTPAAEVDQPGKPTLPTDHDVPIRTAASAEDLSKTRGRATLEIPLARNARSTSPDTWSNLSVEEFTSLHGSAHAATYGPALSQQDADRRTHSAEARSALQRFWRRNKGVALVLMAQVFGTLMNVTTRLLEVEGNNGKGMHPFQILFARMSITVVLASLYMWKKKISDFPLGAKEVRPLLVARGLGGFFGVFGMYYSLLYLPLADATVLTFLAPSLACWACSILINEPFTRMEQVAAGISFIGVVLIARPTSFFGASASTPASPGSDDPIRGSAFNATKPANGANRLSYDTVTPSQRAFAIGIAMVGVMGAASAYTTLRWIGKRAHALISVNYFATWCTIVSTVMMFALPGVGFLLPANPKEWSYLIFLGLCGFIMQFLLASGLQYEKSSRATNMTYTQMLFALAFDRLVFGTTPTFLSVLGSSLILGSAIYVAVQKENTKSRESAVPASDEEVGLVSSIDAEDDEPVEAEPGQQVPLRILRT